MLFPRVPVAYVPPAAMHGFRENGNARFTILVIKQDRRGHLYVWMPDPNRSVKYTKSSELRAKAMRLATRITNNGEQTQHGSNMRYFE